MNFIQNPPDGGMLYAETNLQQYFPEPLNAVTALFFLAIAMYWTFKIYGKIRQHQFLVFALLLLYIGGIGGSIYHGFRQWRIFLMMDWLPIMLLCLSAGVWFIAKLTRWYFAVGIVALYFGFVYFTRTMFRNSDNMQLFININYAVMASIVLLPVIAFLVKTNFTNGKWVGFGLLAFVAALTFRIADGWNWLSSGTHFLWHTFGAIAAFCMLNYVFLVNEKQLAEAVSNH
ncbi:hypothetical protein FNO01nite_16890 [Flavobacterium noncentrifugens]|uniref:Hemolysin III n=1 Tax=Flavobacterium noncentrifugens TaxID=1128970 RepID=A0A1G8WS92_9FLAO|nr:hypothetical protein [Flavobacterium noncentrifugens]GEP51017.1 hypothetical protein FNO01nite_16890 [Flavobacterium noncentrifugens]SDJ80495.1 hemolysin III [Flavobacterium noncentrifugens]